MPSTDPKPAYRTTLGCRDAGRFANRNATSYRYRVSGWTQFLVVAVLVAVARLLFPDVDIRRSVPMGAALLVTYFVIESIVNRFRAGRMKR
jgi:hypothetical protein